MDLHLEELTNESIHSVIDHEYRTVDRIEHGEVQHRPEKVMMLAEAFRPFFECPRPLILVLIECISPFENEFELVVTVILVPENPREVDVELVKVSEVSAVVLLDPDRHRIEHSQGVCPQKVFNLYEVDEILQQACFQRKLCLFKNIILIEWKKFSKHCF